MPDLRPRRYHAPEMEQLYGRFVCSHYDGQPRSDDPFEQVARLEVLEVLVAQRQRSRRLGPRPRPLILSAHRH